MRASHYRLTILTTLLGIVLSACGGGTPVAPPAPQGASPMMFQSAVQAQMKPDVLSSIVVSQGSVNGLDDRFHPADGDTSSGGQGQVVDNLHCNRTMVTNKYHVHVYLGIVHNGQLIATPDTIGMVNAGAESQGFTNSAECFYPIHTHDASGMIHVEANNTAALTQALFHLRQVLDIWGVPHGTGYFGPFSGPIHVYVGNVPLKTTTVTHYNAYTGDLTHIPLHSHTAIFIEIGSTYYTADQLPSVEFYTEY